MSKGPLAKIRQGTRLEVRELGSVAGVAHIVLRRGRCVLALADGWADKEQGTRFTLDTICRLHGSTKALVCAAFLTLLDDGSVKLDDPIEKFVPFSRRVETARGSRPVQAKATLRHLLTMTAGLGYTDDPPYKKVIDRVRNGQVTDLAHFCEELAEVPLLSEPGKRFEYSFCTDILGRVCEVVGKSSLDVFVRERLLEPLGMNDTFFDVPERKKRRVAALYKFEATAAGKRRRTGAAAYKAVRWDHPECAPGIRSSGGGILSYKDAGMWGTARDYARFCQMLLDEGLAPPVAGGAEGAQQKRRRVLSKGVARLIWKDALAPLADKAGHLANWHVDDTEGPPFEGSSWEMCGWSPLNGLLQLQGPLKASCPRRPRAGHSIGLGGGGGTYWLVDAKRRLVTLSFTQSFEGGRDEDDGLGPPGNDCVDLAVDAAREGDAAAKGRR